MRAIIVVDLDLNDHQSIAATQIASAVRAIRSVRTQEMTNEIIIGLGDIAKEVFDYLKEAEQNEWPPEGKNGTS